MKLNLTTSLRLLSITALATSMCASPASAADLNGDGIDDILVGAAGAERVYPIQGSSTDPYYPLFWTHGIPDTGFGSVVTFGDFNCDGYDDVARGMPFYNWNGPDSGQVTIAHGSANGPIEWGIIDQDGLDTRESGDQFGFALASGDFDGDGCDDLAVGAPEEALNNAPFGVVYLYRGTVEGLVDDIRIDQNLIWGGGHNEAGDKFGYSLVSGDFNADGYDDLAVGAPGEDSPGTNGARSGQVHVLMGGDNGMTKGKLLTGLAAHQRPAPADGDDFGVAMAVGDIDGNGLDDLVIGAPGIDLDGNTDTGAGFIYYGRAWGLNFEVFLRQTHAENYDRFANALAVGECNGDGYDEVFVGTPNEMLGGVRAGIVRGYNGSANGVSAFGWLHQGNLGAPGQNADGDEFGASVGVADLDGDGYNEVLIGAPGDLDANDDAVGAVYRYSCDATGVTDTSARIDESSLGSTGVDGGAFGAVLAY